MLQPLLTDAPRAPLCSDGTQSDLRKIYRGITAALILTGGFFEIYALGSNNKKHEIAYLMMILAGTIMGIAYPSAFQFNTTSFFGRSNNTPTNTPADNAVLLPPV